MNQDAGPKQSDAPRGAAEPGEALATSSVFGYEASQVLKLLEIANNEALRQRVHNLPLSSSRDSSRWKTNRYHPATGKDHAEDYVDINSSGMLSVGTSTSETPPH